MLSVAGLRSKLLAWYDANARALPWRVSPADRAAGVLPDPYAVWLSEVMLQQTTVPHATGYFLNFMTRWPKVGDLAQAADAEVMGAWAGLGYYARARNLLACARAVSLEHGGVFPGVEASLRTLPGIGAYTAAAVAAIAFDQPSNVVDGNVERVMARLFAVQTPLPAAKVELTHRAAQLTTAQRPGDWAQALMDLGATICRPKTPNCLLCPITQGCAARAAGDPEAYPRRAAKAERPRRFGVVYVLANRNKVILVQRPTKGLLGGMLGLPTSDWRSMPFSDDEAIASAPTKATWRDTGVVEHTFTHFHLTLRVFAATGPASSPDWRPRADLASLPSVFKKAAQWGLEGLG